MNTAVPPGSIHPETKGKYGKPGHFQVLGGEWQTDDGDGEYCCEAKVNDGQFETGQNDPDDIHNDGYTTARWFSFANLMAERCHPQDG